MIYNGIHFDLEFVHLCWTWDHEFVWKKSCEGLEILQFHKLHHILFISRVYVLAHRHEWLTTTKKKKNKKRRNHWWRFESCSFSISLSLSPSNLFFSCFYVFDHHEWLKKKKKKKKKNFIVKYWIWILHLLSPCILFSCVIWDHE